MFKMSKTVIMKSSDLVEKLFHWYGSRIILKYVITNRKGLIDIPYPIRDPIAKRVEWFYIVDDNSKVSDVITDIPYSAEYVYPSEETWYNILFLYPIEFVNSWIKPRDLVSGFI